MSAESNGTNGVGAAGGDPRTLATAGAALTLCMFAAAFSSARWPPVNERGVGRAGQTCDTHGT